MNNTAPWERSGYGDIVAADRQNRDVSVEFADGDVIRVPAAVFGVTTNDFAVEVDEDSGLELRLIDQARTVNVAWTQLRAAADSAFSQELRRRDAEQARRLGLRLRALREDRQLNQRDLAELVGMSAPQLSKIEAGKTDLRVSTVQSLLRAMGAQLADIAGPDALEVSRKALRSRAEKAGVSADIMQRLVSLTPHAALVQTLSRAFGWAPSGIVEGTLVSGRLNATVRFKSHQPGEPRESPLVHLGFEVAKYVGAASLSPPYQVTSGDPVVIRTEAAEANGQITLRSLLTWSWEHGIPVVPLLGGRGFSAAVWAVDGVPVVVIKEARPPAVYWLFDLAHELGHIVLGHVSDSAIVDIDQINPHASGADEEETHANRFALDLLLPGHDQLLSQISAESQGSYLRFKSAVETVARRAKLSPGLLGMVAAYELTTIGEDKDRWGSATNLAKADGTGRPTTERIARPYLPVDHMKPVEATLIRATVFSE